MTERTNPTRDGRGRYDDDPKVAQQTTARALQLRQQSKSYREIADKMGISVSTAHKAVQRGLRAIVAEPAEDVRALELEKLDALERTVLDILSRQHVVVSAGRVAMLDGSPIPDAGPILAGVTALLRISESRRKLLGLDQPAKVTVDGGVRYEILGVDPAVLT